MLSAVPSNSWGSGSPAFVTEVPADGLQFVASFLPEDDLFGSQDQDRIPSFDESVFDLLGAEPIPDLEEVLEPSCASIVLPATYGFTLEEIPALEDADFGLWNENSTPKQSPKIMTPAMFEEPVEEVVTSTGSPVAIYVESCGSASPMSCYSLASEDAPPEKRRRVSQISNASFCSTMSGSTSAYSPQSTSDSEYEPSAVRKGGRKSKYTAQDRRERKKAQNRSAAERYRMKKKMQEGCVTEEEQKYMDANQDLRTEVTKLEAEVSCLKKLMKEMLLAKGVVIPPRK